MNSHPKHFYLVHPSTCLSFLVAEFCGVIRDFWDLSWTVRICCSRCLDGRGRRRSTDLSTRPPFHNQNGRSDVQCLYGVVYGMSTMHFCLTNDWGQIANYEKERALWIGDEEFKIILDGRYCWQNKFCWEKYQTNSGNDRKNKNPLLGKMSVKQFLNDFFEKRCENSHQKWIFSIPKPQNWKTSDSKKDVQNAKKCLHIFFLQRKHIITPWEW